MFKQETCGHKIQIRSEAEDYGFMLMLLIKLSYQCFCDKFPGPADIQDLN